MRQFPGPPGTVARQNSPVDWSVICDAIYFVDDFVLVVYFGCVFVRVEVPLFHSFQWLCVVRAFLRANGGPGSERFGYLIATRVFAGGNDKKATFTQRRCGNFECRRAQNDVSLIRPFGLYRKGQPRYSVDRIREL